MKLFSSIMVFVFLLQSIAFGANPLFGDASIGRGGIFVPESYGMIEKARFDKELDSKLVILLKDAHCNYDVQHNIAKILEVLVRDYNVELVGMEGAEGELSLERFARLKDEAARDKMADEFVRKGFLTGPEYLAITGHKKFNFNMYGIEDGKLYVENFISFRKTMDNFPQAELFVKELTRITGLLKKNIYPEQLLEFDRKADDYNENILSLTDWIKELKKEGDSVGVSDLSAYSNMKIILESFSLEDLIDYKMVEKERGEAINNLEKVLSKEGLEGLVKRSLQFRLGKISSVEYYSYLRELLKKEEIKAEESFPNLMNYIRLVKLHARIDNNLLFQEISLLEAEIKERLFQDNIQRQLDNVSRKVRILDKLLRLELTRNDLEYYKNNKSEFLPGSFLSLIKIQAVRYNVPFSLLLDEESFLDKVKDVVLMGEDFYRMALERDAALVENTLSMMEKEKKNTAVMVIGGFHTEGIIKQLESKNVGYMVITPKVLKAQKETPYISLMMDKRIKAGSSISFPKLMVDSAENVLRVVVPLGAEGWRSELLDLAMRTYHGFLGAAVAEELPGTAVLPFDISISPDGAVAVERNAGYRDVEIQNLVVEWFRTGLGEVLREDAGMRSFLSEADNVQKYLGRTAVVEYKLRTGHALTEGILHRATISFIQYYLRLCSIYENGGGWLAVVDEVKRDAGDRWREFVPEAIENLEFAEGRELGFRDELIGRLTARASDIGISADADSIGAHVNYLLTMNAYGADNRGDIYQTLFFSSYLGLLKDTFAAEGDNELLELFDKTQAYRFLQLYLGKIFGAEAEQLYAEDNIGAILAGYLRDKSNKGKIVEILARYLTGEKFSGDEAGEIEKVIGRKIPGWEGRKWIKVASSISVVNEDTIPNTLKRDVYVRSVARAATTTPEGEPDELKASDGYMKAKQDIERDLNLKPEDVEVRGLTDRLFIHDVSIDIGEGKQIEEGKYEISDLGGPRIDLIKAIQHSEKNDQCFLCVDDVQKEAAKAYYRSRGINVKDEQFRLVGEYDSIDRKGKIVVTMLTHELSEKVSKVRGDRRIIGNEFGADPILMSRMALVVAEPEDIEEQRRDVEDKIRTLVARYIDGASREEATLTIEDGIITIILPPPTPFLSEHYETLQNARETIWRAA